MTDSDVPIPESATFGSLFSGIEGIGLGLERAGMTVAWQCEKDDAARRVLARHWPDVPRYDDVTTLKGPDVPRVDVLCGGFPCQDLSVAGRRAGLAGERSGLFHEFMRLADELAPRWVLVENVPGLLSSNDGADMGIVLDTLADLGYGWCYRVLDAQYFGVAQRRRRVFIVGCAGDPRRAGEVLLESDCCDGNPPPRREAGKIVAALTADGVGTCGADDNQGQAGHLIPALYQCHGSNVGEMGTLRSGHSIGAGVPFAAYPLAMRGRDDGAELEMGEEGIYNALRAGDGGSSRANWVQQNLAVRRLLPVECERLQGFPDGWTAGETDSARYRLLGNAVCVPVAAWIGRRIMEATGGSNERS